MPLWKLYTGYRCPDCGKSYIIVKSKGKGGWISYLPINWKPGDEIPKFYDRTKKHRSHLLDCKGLQGKWERIKAELLEQEKQKIDFENKLFMR